MVPLDEKEKLFGRVDPGFFFSRSCSNVWILDSRTLPGLEVRAACNRHGCPKEGVYSWAEALFIFVNSDWALVISGSILRCSFFTLLSSMRDSKEDAGGGLVLVEFPTIFAASHLDFFGQAPGSVLKVSEDVINADKSVSET